MKKMLICLLFFGFAVTLVSAGPSEEQVTLAVWTDLSQDWNVSYIDAYRELNPDVELDVTVFGGGDYHSQSRIALESGDKPDVWPAAVGTWLDQFIDGGGAMDITEIAEERGFYDVIAGPFWDFTRRDGRIYGAPYGGIYLWQALFANKKFFEDNNIPYPKTMDELIDIVPRIEAAGMQAVSWGNKDGWPSTLWLGDLVGQLTDVGIVGRLNSGEEKWDESAAMLEAFQTFLKLGDAGVFATGYDVQDHRFAIQAWVAEKVALLYNGTWFYNSAQQAGLDFEVEAIALPAISSSSSLQFVQNSPGSCIMINPDTEVLEAAIDYLDYIVSPDFFRAWGQGESVLTPSPIANPDIELPDWLKSEPLFKQFEYPASDFWTTSFPVPVYEAVMNNIKLMLAGSVTPEEALANIEQEHVGNR